MEATIYHLNGVQDHLIPAFYAPVGGPIRPDARVDINTLLGDIRRGWDFAAEKKLAILSINADRNGAYLVIATRPDLQAVFGDECALVSRKTEAGFTTEIWLGCVGEIRVFWRDVKCVH